MIFTSNLNYFIGNKAILKNINIELKAGTFNVIIGPNGSGKTTLLKNLTGDLRPKEGKIFYATNQLDTKDALVLAQRRSVLEQQFHTSFPFTGRQILEVGALEPEETDLRLAVGEFSLQELLDQKVTTMSGGEMQRLHAARVYLQALASKQPSHCIFLDEPTSALDIGFQIKVMGAFKKLCDSRGITVCAIFHDLNLTRIFADQVIMLKKGEVFRKGTATEIISEPLIRELFDVDQSSFLNQENCIRSFSVIA